MISRAFSRSVTTVYPVKPVMGFSEVSEAIMYDWMEIVRVSEFRLYDWS